MSLLEIPGVDMLYDSRKLADMNKLWEYPMVISYGYGHCIALKKDGTLVSWGYDGYRQVTDTPTGNDFVQVSCGGQFTTALKKDGSLVSWGGVLYNGSSYVVAPAPPTGNDFVQVSCGTHFATALKKDGSLVSWGYVNNGTSWVVAPAPPTGNDFVQVSCGYSFATALKKDGSLVSWGYVNIGTSWVVAPAPPIGNDYVQVSCGHSFATALKKDGSLVSWGYVNNGTSWVVAPAPPIGNDYVQLSCGGYFATALKKDGSLVSWGYVNNGTSMVNISVPPIGNDYVQVSCGHSFATALKKDGSLVSWGSNFYYNGSTWVNNGVHIIDTPVGNICRFRNDIILLKDLVSVKTINDNVLIGTNISGTPTELDYYIHGFENISHLDNLLIDSNNIELLQLTKSPTSTNKSVINIDKQTVNFRVKVNHYTSPLTTLTTESLQFTVPKEAFQLGDNNLILEVISKDSTMNKEFFYNIIKEDRDTFILNRRLERDESHILSGDVTLSAGEGIKTNGTGKGEVVIEIPTIGKSTIKSIKGTEFTESTHINDILGINSDMVNINGVGYNQSIDKENIKELVKSIVIERGE